MPLIDRLQHAWNAFMNRDPTRYFDSGRGSRLSPYRVRFSRGNERSIATAVYNRIALDVAGMSIKHVRLDEDKRFTGVINSGLNECLNLSANLDQTGRAFMQDVVVSLLDEGSVAIVPVDTTLDPKITQSYDILSMRTAKIVEWFPKHVRVSVYNENTGNREEVKLPKNMVAIIENPFYSVMNEPNSTLQRLIRKLNILDAIDEQSGSGKLDMIVQVPYATKTPNKKRQAEERRQDLENQLADSKYGVAYIDATEHITQLNRPVENNLMKQIEYLTNLFFSQLGITQSILDGTADEKTMLNYNNRTVEPIISAIVDEMKRKFLSKTARSQNQSIKYFIDPFKLVPVSEVAEISDKLTRNEIASSNEIRQVIGWIPSKDPKADELRNKNLSEPGGGQQPTINKESEEESQNET